MGLIKLYAASAVFGAAYTIGVGWVLILIAHHYFG